MPALSRRALLAIATAVPAAAALGVTATAEAATDKTTDAVADPATRGPVDRAYRYLDTVMDAYATGDEPRLLQSYNNESGLLTTAFVYDNALALIAYLACPTREHVRRAKVIGDTFLWLQANDERFADGRVRQAYAAGPMLFYGGGPFFPGIRREDGKAAFLWPFGFSGSAVGDMAWVGLSLVHLYARTRERRYLDGAVALGNWIVTTSTSPHAFKGYVGGVQGDGTTVQPWSSTEHNIDCFGLFTLLAKHTRDRSWHAKAASAHDFVTAMFNPAGGYFWTGTQAAAPDLINKDILPEDVNTWQFLALGEHRFAGAVDWVAANLGTADPAGFSGVTFSDFAKRNADAVWFEGTAHLAAALRKDSARGYLYQIIEAQKRLGGGQTIGRTTDPAAGRLSNPGEGGSWTGHPLPAASGIVAASKTFDTGFGFSYFPHQHVGATSWFVLAAVRLNPYG